MDQLQASSSAVVLKCPVCSNPLAALPTRTCPECETPVHIECGDLVGGCPRFACPEAATAGRRVAEYLKVRLDQTFALAMGGATCLGAYFLAELRNISQWALRPLDAIFVLSLGGFAMAFACRAFSTYTERRSLEIGGVFAQQLLALLRRHAPGTPVAPESVVRVAQDAHWYKRIGGALIGFGSLSLLPLILALILTNRPPTSSAWLSTIGCLVLGGGTYLGGAWFERAREISRTSDRLTRLWRDELEAAIREDPTKGELVLLLGEKAGPPAESKAHRQ
jgi:hypothetical protein